ncbi:multidrug effflux MFS transporter [Streptomyces sp. NPDC087270]|uniref:multidrug effflux MFS transporter n=1 Tax=Streptomyces sp. NPDC087270 TaxID=3365774 RepID=UPI00380D6BE5
MESAAVQDAGPDTPAQFTATPAPTPAPSPTSTPIPAPHSGGPRGPRPAQARAGFVVTLALGGLTALPPLSMDMYLPALPRVSQALHASSATAQISVTACLAGMALGQLVVGPLSDRWGRRAPLLTGMVIYVLATVACAFAPTVALLIAFRLIQGLAGSAGIVISRAVVRDMYDGLAMARFFSNLQLISGVAPIIAPAIGGQVLRLTDWRGIFVLCAVVGTLLTLVCWRRLQESLPPEGRHAGGLTSTFGSIRGLVADRVFTGYVLAASFAFAALFTYVSASSFVVQDIYGASPQTYGLLFGLNSVGLVAVGQFNGKVLMGRVEMNKVLGVGLALITLASTALVLLTTGVLGRATLPEIAAALFVLMASMGLVMPTANTSALLRTRRHAGAASALLGTSSFLVGAVLSPLSGVAGDGTAVPMAVTQLGCVLVAVACFVGLCLRGRRTVEGP